MRSEARGNICWRRRAAFAFHAFAPVTCMANQRRRCNFADVLPRIETARNPATSLQNDRLHQTPRPPRQHSPPLMREVRQARAVPKGEVDCHSRPRHPAARPTRRDRPVRAARTDARWVPRSLSWANVKLSRPSGERDRRQRLVAMHPLTYFLSLAAKFAG